MSVRAGSRYGWLLVLISSCALAQNPLAPDPTAPVAAPLLPPLSGSEKWDFFVSDTFTPFTLLAAGLDATVSQLTRSAPLYGKHFWRGYGYPKRFGATLADAASQNFFADFLLASAFHEDTRYFRKGPSQKMWPRIGYAISRAVVTRTDSGSATFNWANVTGCATSAALSNVYYPPVSRTASVATVNWATNVAGSGLTNLMPEFGPDIGHWFKQHLHFHR